MSFRVATVADAKSMKKCNESCLPENYPLELWKRVLEKNPGVSVLSMQNPNRIRGYILMVLEDEMTMMLFSLAVYHKYRGKGVGSALISQALENVREKCPKVKLIKLQVRVSNPAIALYERYGFVKFELLKGYYDDGEDAIEMRLKMGEPKVMIDASSPP